MSLRRIWAACLMAWMAFTPMGAQAGRTSGIRLRDPARS